MLRVFFLFNETTSIVWTSIWSKLSKCHILSNMMNYWLIKFNNKKNHFKQHDNWQKWKKSTNLQTRHRLQLCWQIQTNVYCFRQTRINTTSFVGFCCFNQLIYSLAGDIRQRVHANWKFSTMPISSMEHDTNWFKIYILI